MAYVCTCLERLLLSCNTCRKIINVYFFNNWFSFELTVSGKKYFKIKCTNNRNLNIYLSLIQANYPSCLTWQLRHIVSAQYIFSNDLEVQTEIEAKRTTFYYFSIIILKSSTTSYITLSINITLPYEVVYGHQKVVRCDSAFHVTQYWLYH